MSSAPSPSAPRLDRSLGLIQATALNVSNMVGIGPFITIPLFIATMGGPQALVGWVVAAVLVLCDGLVWSELGAALPGSGATYHFLKVIFGQHRWGQLIPFLFIWQFLVSGTLEIASGYIGSMDYVKYIFPNVDKLVVLGGVPWGSKLLAAAGCGVVTLLLCRRTGVVGWLGVALCAGSILTTLTVIAAGLTHFDASLLRMSEDAFRWDWKLALGLGGAMRIAVYDYFGYYNICHLGDEVKNPGRTIPIAVILSVLFVAVIYLTMNVCILAVVPWQEAMNSRNIAALFMERLFGRDVAVGFTWMIIWTSVACLFSITLGYSRIPFAAAKAGDFFRPFAYVHPRQHYPVVSLLALGALTAAFCFVPLDMLINAAVTVRILVQFIGQIAGLHVLRTTRPDVPLPFRMWFYPVPSAIAFIGWIFLWATSEWVLLIVGAGVIASGCVVFWAWRAISPRRRGSLPNT